MGSIYAYLRKSKFISEKKECDLKAAVQWDGERLTLGNQLHRLNNIIILTKTPNQKLTVNNIQYVTWVATKIPQ